MSGRIAVGEKRPPLLIPRGTSYFVFHRRSAPVVISSKLSRALEQPKLRDRYLIIPDDPWRVLLFDVSFLRVTMICSAM